MKIVEKYSHLNSEDYLIVHYNDIYEEIKDVISTVNASDAKTKVCKEKGREGDLLYSPAELNSEFKRLFEQRNWKSSVNHSYYVTTDYSIIQKLITLPPSKQKKFLTERGAKSLIRSRKQIDFLKRRVAIEVQFGMRESVAYDLFVKHLFFYSGGIIDIGVEILPMKSMQSEMSTGIAYYEGEVYNILRHGRNNPPVPLLIMGVVP